MPNGIDLRGARPRGGPGSRALRRLVRGCVAARPRALPSSILACLLATVLLPAGCRAPGAAEQIRSLAGRNDVNVLFVVIDTLRADRLGAYGYARNTTPVMDRLASRGVRFSNVVAQSSWTRASMASIWLGAHPARTGILRYRDAIPPEATLPAEILREAGFLTAGLFRNGWVEPKFGFAQGFDHYLEPRLGELRPGFRRGITQGGLRGTDYDLCLSASEFLRSFKHRRFLLYLHFMDLHQYAFDASYALFGSKREDLYDNALRWTDANLGRLLRELEDLGLGERTLVVVASDHGEEFGEHGRLGHGTTLYREVVRTPLILSFPFPLERPRVVDALVENVDIWPTLLDLLGLPPLPHATGRSRVSLLLGEAAQGAEVAYSQLDRAWGMHPSHKKSRPIAAVTTPRWRLIKGLAFPRLELYDRIADPLEANDLADHRPDVVSELGGLLDDHLARAAQGRLDPATEELDAARLEELRALGYVVR